MSREEGAPVTRDHLPPVPDSRASSGFFRMTAKKPFVTLPKCGKSCAILAALRRDALPKFCARNFSLE
jgi:hypothetical protein